MDLDDGLRRGYAVGISFGNTVGDRLRLILDDLEFVADAPPTWEQWAFFTFIDLPLDRATENRLSERELASIGEAVLARLLAFKSLEPTEDS